MDEHRQIVWHPEARKRKHAVGEEVAAIAQMSLFLFQSLFNVLDENNIYCLPEQKPCVILQWQFLDRGCVKKLTETREGRLLTSNE